MKLASLKTESRDGALIVVSRDLSRAVSATDIAATLQWAVEHWESVKPHLQELSDAPVSYTHLTLPTKRIV